MFVAKVERPCEALEHVASCNGIGSTKDHFTPRCIAKELGWRQGQVSDPQNIQWLSEDCHKEKDSTTPLRLSLLRKQLQGIPVGFSEHITVFLNPLK